MRDLESVLDALDTRRELDYKYSSLGTILTYMDLMQNQVFGENLTIYSKSENGCLLNLAWFSENGLLRVRYSGRTENMTQSFSQTKIPKRYHKSLPYGEKALYRLYEQFQTLQKKVSNPEETELEIILNITQINMQKAILGLIDLIHKQTNE